MNILDKIVAFKLKEVAQRKEVKPVAALEQSPMFERSVNSLREALLQENSSGIIAEFKRQSPSAGIINDKVSVEGVTRGYVQAGASGLSVLTDSEFFGGSSADLELARETNPKTPILRKDFIVDAYQILEAKAMGADVILLIAECLDQEQVVQLSTFAKKLGLDVLMEIHSGEQLEKLNPNIDIVGVNNRNLKTFKTSLEASFELAEQIPVEFVKISESGISNPQAIVALRSQGYRGFLIGENFMRTADPGESCAEFIRKVAYMEDLLHNAIV